MKWNAAVLCVLLLSACNQYVVEPLDIVVPQKYTALELGNNPGYFDVTETTMKSY